MKPYPSTLRRRVVSIAGFLSLALILPMHANDLPYDSGSTGADGPLDIPRPIGDRTAHAAAFDESAGRLMVFGGRESSVTVNDTWLRDTPHWEQRNPIVSPPSRYNHAMVYDAARQQILLFGGQPAVGPLLADTWVWSGQAWEQKSPASSPPARYGHAMVYDSVRQRVLLFGGFSSNYLDDTWEWDGTNWTQASPANKPAARRFCALAYDRKRQRTVLFGGFNANYGGSRSDTWEWDGTNWVERVFTIKPANRYEHAMAYDRVREEIVLFGGWAGSFSNIYNDTWTYSSTGWVLESPANNPGAELEHTLSYDPVLEKVVKVGGSNRGRETWIWDGADWNLESSDNFTFDMTARNSGVWNFTTINLPTGVTVRFLSNLLNTPVQWLASGNVRIDGILDLNGESGRDYNNVETGNEALPGPGGYRGGLGGKRFSISGSYFGTPGDGPGGGAPGGQIQNGGHGTYNGVYGNTFIQPLLGGSGGGGSGSFDGGNGGNGGAGGGAILIASSGDIQINGTIRANGGSGSTAWSTSYRGGTGSGGAIRLIADRVLGSGQVTATGSGTSGGGRIRIEGYFRPLASSNVNPTPSAAPPTETFAGLGDGTGLTIASVHGANVRQPPQGNTANPDVIFTEEGPVIVVVAGANIPDGTPVTLRITTSGGIISLPATGAPPVTMSGNSASFTATVPAGVGTIQAYATVTLTP
jgi:hypothetical protein